MYFYNFANLVHMDGHGLYVWSTYGIGMAVVAYNVVAPLLSRKQIVRRIKRQMTGE